MRAKRMRITGGTLRGRHVDCPPGVIRPSMDMMREALFSILGDLSGSSFLDLYSGSGIVGLEAVSRGARPVVCVERDRQKREVLENNLILGGDSIRLVISPVERYLKRTEESFDVVFADPPFAYTEKSSIAATVDRYEVAVENGLFVMHHPGDDLPSTIGRFRCVDSRRYGGSHLVFYRSTTPDQ